MEKDKLLEEFKNMEVSNPQEIVGGRNIWVPYDTNYTTVRASYNDANIFTGTDKQMDTETDYREDGNPPIGEIVSPVDSI